MLDTTIEALDFLVTTSQKRDEWDEIPMLMIVTASGKNTLAALDGDIFEMLETVGSRLRESVGGDVTGLILTNEGWGLKSDAAGVKDLQKEVAELHLTGRRFADHPAAVEIKIFTAIDREGIEARQVERGNPVVDIRREGMSGRLVDHLKALFAEVTA